MTKRVLLTLLFLLLLFAAGWSQTFFECPRFMRLDSLNGNSARFTEDFWFNLKSDSTGEIFNSGSVDLDMYCTMTNKDSSYKDTLTVDVYALKVKTLYSDRSRNTAEGRFTTFAFDSVRITTTLAVDSLFHSYALDEYFGSNMYLMDGVRVSVKTNSSSNPGAVSDSSIVQSNCKVYYEKKNRFW